MNNNKRSSNILCAFTCAANWDDMRKAYRTRYEFALGMDGGLTISFNGAPILGGEGEDRIDAARLKKENVEHVSAGHGVFLSATNKGLHVRISEHGSRTGDFVIEPDGNLLANREVHDQQAQKALRSLGFIQESGPKKVLLCRL